MADRNDLPPISSFGAKPLPAAGTTDVFVPEDTGVDGLPGKEKDDASLPAEIGPFRILSLIGRGGMGVVYRAVQDRPSREVALKVLSPERNSPALRRRFEHESAVLARLSHAGIAPIYQAGVAETTLGTMPYFAMELIGGEPLTVYADKHQLDIPDRVQLILQVCDAVQHAHQQGVIHRDLKPANILVDADGQAKVLDFGIAKLVSDDAVGETQLGDVLGTVEYMSPEQARGRPDEVDSRSDVYTLGVILYELMAGQHPFNLTGQGMVERLHTIANDDPPRLAAVDSRLRGDLDTIVAKAMEKEKERRYASASELAADLQRYLADEPVLARPASAWYLLGKFARKRRPLVLSAGFVLTAVLAAVILSTYFGLSEREQRKKKEIAEQQTLEQLIQVAMQRGQWRDALNAVDQALATRKSDSIRLRLDEIRLRHILGDRQGPELVAKLGARSDLSEAERNELDFLHGDMLLVGDPVTGRRLLEKAASGPLPEADREYALGLNAPSLDSALKHFQAAVEVQPFHLGARLQLSYLFIMSGRWPQANEALAVAEAAFPQDPSVVILRFLMETFRGNAASLESTLNRLRPVLGDKVEELRLIARGIQTAFGDSSNPSNDLEKEQELFGKLVAQLSLLGNSSPQFQSVQMPTFPPIFQANLQLMSLALIRYLDPKYADELGAAARNWPDAIFFQAWGDTLTRQKRWNEAVEAYASAMNASTMFTAVRQRAIMSRLLALSKLYQNSEAAKKDDVRRQLLDHIRTMADRYRGPAAVNLKRMTYTGQNLGWVMSDLAWQCGDLDLARVILKEWEAVDPQNPTLWAERAMDDYYSGAYRSAMESAKKSLDLKLRDPLLKENVQFILTDAPKKMHEQAVQAASPGSTNKKP